MGFSVLTNAEQQSSRVKYQKAGLRGLQYTNEHKTEGFQHVKVLQIRGVDKVRQGRVQSGKVHQGRIVECHRTQEKGSSRSKYVKSGLQRCRDHRIKGTSASKYGKTGLRDTDEGLQRTKYVKAGNSASKYVKTGLRRQQKAQGRVPARQSTSNQGFISVRVRV